MVLPEPRPPAVGVSRVVISSRARFSLDTFCDANRLFVPVVVKFRS